MYPRNRFLLIPALLLTAAATVLLPAGCGERSASPPAYVLASAPDGAVMIDALRAGCVSGELAPGHEIVVVGRVGAPGRAVGAEAAVFTLLDLGVEFCPEGGTCCAEPDEMRARSVTVRLVDQDGQPMLFNLAETVGLRDGAEVVVRGTIHAADEHAVVIDAPALHIVAKQS
jgi:hypothetical protein